VEDWQVFVETMAYLQTANLPSHFNILTFKGAFLEAKFFLCVCSAWDLMLGPAIESKRQRIADVQQFKNTVASNCSDLFPAILMKLLDSWQEGTDIANLLP
jgi:hypothetical protein